MNSSVLFLAFVIASAGLQKDSADTGHLIKVIQHKMTITQALEKYTDKWMKISGVIGTGEGETEGKPCIKVFTAHNSAAIKKRIPKVVDGYNVVLEEIGEIKAR